MLRVIDAAQMLQNTCASIHALLDSTGIRSGLLDAVTILCCLTVQELYSYHATREV